MKKLLPILCLLIIASCSKEIPSDQLIERQGLYYEINSQTPFSGRVVSYSYIYGSYNHETVDEYDNGLIICCDECSYCIDNQLKEKVNLKKDKSNFKDGPFEAYFKNSQLESKGNFKDGEWNGLYESYYENGLLREKANWKDGELDGFWESYYENGLLREKANWKDGKKDGLYELYFMNGQLEVKENYKDGELEGLSEQYSENGQLESKPPCSQPRYNTLRDVSVPYCTK
jgi:antitoxin component YwqK of YwqJK toxin-antitoxin module